MGFFFKASFIWLNRYKTGLKSQQCKLVVTDCKYFLALFTVWLGPAPVALGGFQKWIGGLSSWENKRGWWRILHDKYMEDLQEQRLFCPVPWKKKKSISDYKVYGGNKFYIILI